MCRVKVVPLAVQESLERRSRTGFEIPRDLSTVSTPFCTLEIRRVLDPPSWR